MSVASCVKFSELSGLLEKISKLSKFREKQELLTKFIRYWMEYSEKLHPNNEIKSNLPNSFYSVLRLLLPNLDKKRSAYGIKEWTLAKLYCDILCIGENSDEGKNLFHYGRGTGDLADMAYKVLLMRCNGVRLLTIEEVNIRLENIAEASGPHRKEIIKENLIYLHENSSALDQKWLIRMILKSVSFGMTQKTIFKCYHPSAEDLYNVTTDLELVCSRIKSCTDTLDSIDILLFKPFKPMLSERGDIKTILTRLDNKAFLYETKFDGERVQLHKDDEMYRYWSRNGLEWTKVYGLTRDSGTLTQFIANQFKSSARNCILDGEMMGFNNVTNTMGSRAEDFDIKSPHVERTSGYSPCFIIFDVLYLNDEILTKKSVLERKRLLDTEILTSELHGKIQIAKYTQATTREECLSGFNRAIENCDEGIIVKRIDSEYQVNSRKAGWFKMKPDYVLGLHEEIDCVIIGGYFSSKKIIGQFLCAVKLYDSNEDKNRYLSFCRVGTGFTRKVLYEFNVKMANNWKAYKKENPPAWLVLAPRFREKPDIYIEPENSFIVQLKAAEIVSSENYATKCTLRFSRIDCFREDKSPVDDCMTITELENLRAQHKGKLALHPLEIDSETELEKSTSSTSKTPRSKRRFQLPDCYKSEVPNKKLVSENVENSIFVGKEFAVLISPQSDKGLDKKQLEKFIYDNGGIVVQNPGKSTSFVIADRVTLKIQNIIKSNKYDIVTLDWLAQCLREKTFIALKPNCYLSMKPTTVKCFENLYDKFGDSYTDEITSDELKELLNDMNNRGMEGSQFEYEDRIRFVDSLSCDDIASTYLSVCVVHFYVSDNVLKPTIVQLSEIKRLKIGFKLSGAKLVDDISKPNVSHIIMPRHYSVSDIRHVHFLNRQRDFKFFIVSLDWAIDVLDNSSRLPENTYMIKNVLTE